MNAIRLVRRAAKVAEELKGSKEDRKDWKFRSGVKLLVNPSVVCPYCKEMAETGRTWLIDENKGKVLRVWDLVGREIKAGGCHPHVESTGGVCLGNAKNVEEAMLYGIAPSDSYNSAYDFMWLIGHRCQASGDDFQVIVKEEYPSPSLPRVRYVEELEIGPKWQAPGSAGTARISDPFDEPNEEGDDSDGRYYCNVCDEGNDDLTWCAEAEQYQCPDCWQEQHRTCAECDAEEYRGLYGDHGGFTYIEGYDIYVCETCATERFFVCNDCDGDFRRPGEVGGTGMYGEIVCGGCWECRLEEQRKEAEAEEEALREAELQALEEEERDDES